jgi:molybdopterin molybdotransferase
VADGPIELSAARAAVLAEVEPLGAVQVALAEALDRVLAEDLRAGEPVPAFDNSAMDGYALRAADTAGAGGDRPVALRLVDESRAGAPATARLAVGEVARVSTGAVLPPGADAVLRQEEARVEGDRIEARAPLAPGHDVRRAGEDIAPGARVLARGARLGPTELGVAASLGLAQVACARRPLVQLVTTGDELALPGEERGPGGVWNSNAYSVPAQAARAGADVRVGRPVPDDAAATRAALGEGLDGADVLVVCGGVSVGPHDHVKDALAARGVEQRFWRAALRPGGPVWFGVLARDGARALVFGLPGNPVSAMVTFQLLARPALLALQGADPAARTATAILDADVRKRPGRLHAIRCRLSSEADGLHARPTGPQGSHVLTSMLGADALALIPAASAEVRAGERVTVELLDR